MGLRRVVSVAVVALTAVACRQLLGLDEPQLSRDGGTPSDGGPPVPDAGLCTGTSAECIGDVLRACPGAGMSAIDLTCGWGCKAAPVAHCAQLLPAGGALTAMDVSADPALGDKTLDAVFLDSDTGQIGTAQQPNLLRGSGAGVVNGIDYELRGGVGMFRFRTVTFGSVLLLGSRAIAIVGVDRVTVNGTVDARCPMATVPSSPVTVAGPGGFDGGGRGGSANGSGAGGAGPAPNEGGGGGGYGGRGGVGGDGAGIAGGAGGARFGDAQISTLVGGGGGGGGNGGAGAGSGGGGGGAVQLVSNGTVTVSGGINAGGCGGNSGSGSTDGGGGGGAGGTILLEAPAVSITGALAVNGGGGGGGATATSTPGSPGRLDRTPAAGGGQNSTPGGPGGAGGIFDGAPGSNLAGHGGGGGGGVGRIRITTRTGTAQLGATAVLSPSFTDTSTTCTQAAAATQ